MTTRQFNSFIAAVSIWIVMIYYLWLDNSPFDIGIAISPAWYWWMFLLGLIPLWIFIADTRQRR